MEVVIRYLGLFILAALLSTCCIINDNIYNGITNAKSIWFLSITGVSLIYLAWIRLRNNRIAKFNSLDLSVGIFLLYLIVNNTLHDGQLLTRKNLENTGLFVSYLFTKRTFQDKHFSNAGYLILILLLIFSQIIIAVLQWFEVLPTFNSNFKFSGFFFNPSAFVTYLSAIVVYCLGAYLFIPNKIIKATSLAIFILALPIVIISLSRSTWIGLLVCVIFFFLIRFRIFFRKKIFSLKKPGLKIIYPIAGILIFFIFGYYLYYLKKESADGRILIWKLSFKIIGDHPLNGIGQENFPGKYLQYQSLYFQNNPAKMLTEGRLADTVYYAFNDLLQVTVEQGIIGLILFGLVIFKGIQLSFRLFNFRLFEKRSISKNVILIGSMGSLTVILVSGLFSYPLVMLPIQVLFYSSLGILSSYFDELDLRLFTYRVSGSGKMIYFIVIFLFSICFWCYSVALNRVYYMENCIKRTGYDNIGMVEISKYKLLVGTESWYLLRQCDYLLHYGYYKEAKAEMENAINYTSNKTLSYSLASLYIFDKQYDKAEKQYKFLYYALPGLVEPKYRLAKFYYDRGQERQWLRVARELISFKPKIPSNAGQEMISEIRDLYYDKFK